MWVVKLGGSLNTDASLRKWLSVLAEAGGGRVLLVCGGGGFADKVRQTQSHWQFDDLAAHNMALLAMAQTAIMLQALNPALQLVTHEAQVHDTLRQGRVALWSPVTALSRQAGPDTNWSLTSDSIALQLAKRLQARKLVLVKSCAAPLHSTPDQWGHAELVDARFAALSHDATCAISIFPKEDHEVLRALLLAR